MKLVPWLSDEIRCRYLETEMILPARPAIPAREAFVLEFLPLLHALDIEL
jgi:hypothetical protein